MGACLVGGEQQGGCAATAEETLSEERGKTSRAGYAFGEHRVSVVQSDLETWPDCSSV